MGREYRESIQTSSSTTRHRRYGCRAGLSTSAFSRCHSRKLLCRIGVLCFNVPHCIRLGNQRMVVETSFSMLTVVYSARKFLHRVSDYIWSHCAYLAAIFSVLYV